MSGPEIIVSLGGIAGIIFFSIIAINIYYAIARWLNERNQRRR
jgi:hypothetical protein